LGIITARKHRRHNMETINNRPAYTRDELLKMVKNLKLLTEFELPERKSIFEVRLYDKAHKYCNVYVELILQINFELAERYKGRKNTILEITGCMVHCSEHTNDAKKLSLFFEQVFDALKVLALFKRLVAEQALYIVEMEAQVEKNN
jgi:hypothetical protein